MILMPRENGAGIILLLIQELLEIPIFLQERIIAAIEDFYLLGQIQLIQEGLGVKEDKG
jgi:hypothetical protein